MKKLYIVLIIILVSFLCCCGYRTMTPNLELPNSYELLFDLPENVEIVSEEFVFEMDIPGYNHYCYSPPMQVTATYEIVNNSEEAEFSFGLPFISGVRSYDSDIQSISLMLQNDEIYLENNQHHKIVTDYQFSEVTYDYFYSQTIFEDKSYNQTIYKYHLGSNIIEDLSFAYNDNSKIVINGDFTGIVGTVNIPSATDNTIIYSFENEIQFTSNNIIHSEINYDAFIEEIEVNQIVKPYVEQGLEDFLLSDANLTGSNRLSSSITDDETNILFFNTKTLSIEENGAITISLVRQLWASYDKIELLDEFDLRYNFYFDSERYKSDNIDIQIYLISEYDFDIEYIDFEENLLMFDINESNHLQLNTVYVN